MAEKITPRENCVFCDEQPCVCETISRQKALRNAPPGTVGFDDSDRPIDEAGLLTDPVDHEVDCDCEGCEKLISERHVDGDVVTIEPGAMGSVLRDPDGEVIGVIAKPPIPNPAPPERPDAAESPGQAAFYDRYIAGHQHEYVPDHRDPGPSDEHIVSHVVNALSEPDPFPDLEPSPSTAQHSPADKYGGGTKPDLGGTVDDYAEARQGPLHMLKERKGDKVFTRCGLELRYTPMLMAHGNVTAWESQVTCADCDINLPENQPKTRPPAEPENTDHWTGDELGELDDLRDAFAGGAD